MITFFQPFAGTTKNINQRNAKKRYWLTVARLETSFYTGNN